MVVLKVGDGFKGLVMEEGVGGMVGVGEKDGLEGKREATEKETT